MNLRHIAKDFAEAYAKSLRHSGETIHFPGGAIAYADKLPLNKFHVEMTLKVPPTHGR